VSPEESTSERVDFELRQITKELQVVGRVNQIRQASELDEIQIRAAASSLQSIYNGIEKILVSILKQRSFAIEESTAWHSEVLEAAIKTKVISEDLGNNLKDFMGFRHFYRHNYGFMLDGELLKPLLDRIADTVDDLRRQLRVYGGGA